MLPLLFFAIQNAGYEKLGAPAQTSPHKQQVLAWLRLALLRDLTLSQFIERLAVNA